MSNFVISTINMSGSMELTDEFVAAVVAGVAKSIDMSTQDFMVMLKVLSQDPDLRDRITAHHTYIRITT